MIVYPEIRVTLVCDNCNVTQDVTISMKYIGDIYRIMQLSKCELGEYSYVWEKYGEKMFCCPSCFKAWYGEDV